MIYFRQFLYGNNFKVLTDHKPLEYCLTAPELKSRHLRWFNRLNPYRYTIEYRKGKKNGNADGLSRLPNEDSEDEHENVNEEEPIPINVVQTQDINEDPVIINIIIAECEDLDRRQMNDQNLVWFYNLKIEA